VAKIVGVVLDLDPVSIKFADQGRKSQFKVTGGNAAKVLDMRPRLTAFLYRVSKIVPTLAC